MTSDSLRRTSLRGFQLSTRVNVRRSRNQRIERYGCLACSSLYVAASAGIRRVVGVVTTVIPRQGGGKALDRGGEDSEPKPELQATVDSNAVRKQKTPPTVQDDRDPRAGLGRLYRRGETQNTVANDQCQVLAGRPAHRQGGSAQRKAPMCVHR